jgi:hypothetical protein
MTVYALSIHADYRCRHSGECCTADWDVPVEVPIFRSLSDALAVGRLRTAAGAGDGFITGPDLPSDAGAMLDRTAGGDCVFFERGSHLCVVHRDLGEQALPATCRHFPRLALRDARGTSITLSHFCPTAASMLFREDVPLAIVPGPAAFPDAEYEGLVVAPDEWPPLLNPRMLSDHEGYAAWERHMVARCAEAAGGPESIVASLARDAWIVRKWRPGSASIAQAIGMLPRDVVDAPPHGTLDASLAHFAEAMTAVPEDLLPPADEHGLPEAYRAHVVPEWESFAGPLARYVAAKAFATWTAYQGRGFATIVRGLDCALALVRVEASRQCRDTGRRLDGAQMLEAFRAADFILNHLAAGDELARAWSRAENG